MNFQIKARTTAIWARESCNYPLYQAESTCHKKLSELGEEMTVWRYLMHLMDTGIHSYNIDGTESEFDTSK